LIENAKDKGVHFILCGSSLRGLKMSGLNLLGGRAWSKMSILELDELFTYCQKKLTKSTFGLLLIVAEIRLLTLK